MKSYFVFISSFFLFLVVINSESSAKQCYTIKNGYFHDSTIWIGNQKPCTGDTVKINHIVTYDRTEKCNFELLIIPKNAELTIKESTQMNLIEIQREGIINNHGIIEQCSK